jgi:glycerate 2-kinase
VRVTGSGLGGRNQECALGMVRGLNTFGRQAIAASVGTDGVDGPTNAAGAIADTTTLSRAMTAGLETPERHLDNNDSYRFFDRLGDLILTGPTNTNVGDLQVILIG